MELNARRCAKLVVEVNGAQTRFESRLVVVSVLVEAGVERYVNNRVCVCVVNTLHTKGLEKEGLGGRGGEGVSV